MTDNRFIRWLSREVLASDTRLHRLLIVGLFYCLAMFLLYTHLLILPQEFREGQVVPYTVFAPVTFEYEDSQKLAELTGNLSEGQLVNRFDSRRSEVAAADFQNFVQDFDQLRRDMSRGAVSDEDSAATFERLVKRYNIDQTLLESFLHFSDDRLNQVFAEARTLLTQEMADGVTVAYLHEVKQRGLADLLTKPQYIYVFFLQPNLGEYIAPDLRAKRQTLARVTIEKGSVVVAEGSIVTARVHEQLAALHDHLLEQNLYRYIGLGLLLLAAMSWWYFYLLKYNRKLLAVSSISQLGGLLLIFLLVGLLIGRLPFNYFYYAVAFAVAALAAIIVLVYDAIFALYISLGLALILGVALSFGANLTLYLLGSALLPAVILAPGCARRQQVLFSLAMGFINIVLAVIVILVSVQTLHWEIFLIAFLAGFTAAVLALGLLPVVETLSAQLTPGKLVELANPENDLLRRLKREAHGTYVHSEMVADLTEEACKEINADWLLAKVGALYHDIGKIKRPGFFAENIHDKSKNPHSQLPPETSVKILRDHVADGLQMAREARLPKELHQFIAQHHGSYSIRYFLHKAKVQHTEAPEEHPEPRPESFNYSGPKPQNRETAVLMLADVTEAVIRALGSVDQDEVHAGVERVISDKLKDDQLVESGLTIGDLKRIKDAFVRILTAQQHSRIRYPDELAPPVQFHLDESNGKVDPGR